MYPAETPSRLANSLPVSLSCTRSASTGVTGEVVSMALLSHNAMYSPSAKYSVEGKDTAERLSHPARVPRPATKPAANHLRAWREFRKLTQEELADKVGTTGNVISLLESGDRGLSHKWLLKLAPVLETTPGFLLDHDPNDLDSAFLEAAMAVPKESREQVLQILKTFRTGTGG